MLAGRLYIDLVLRSSRILSSHEFWMLNERGERSVWSPPVATCPVHGIRGRLHAFDGLYDKLARCTEHLTPCTSRRSAVRRFDALYSARVDCTRLTRPTNVGLCPVSGRCIGRHGQRTAAIFDLPALRQQMSEAQSLTRP